MKGTRAWIIGVGTTVAVLATGSPATASTFSDVPAGYWAKTAIDYVAWDRSWLRDFGTDEFRPEARLRRKHLARAAVRAFAPTEEPDPAIVFDDLPEGNFYWRFANIAVKLGWMTAPGGEFEPWGKVPKRDLDRVLVKALKLGPEVHGLLTIATAGGYRFAHPKGFPFLTLAGELGLHYNQSTSTEWRELLPATNVRRADGAYALYRAAMVEGTYALGALDRYKDIVLPTMGGARKQAVEWALGHVGYPYIYAGEWATKTPAGYCCGSQPQGGFDCSGFAWWVLRKPSTGWNVTKYRPYAGWALPQRSSKDMAHATVGHLNWPELQPMDLMFFDGDGGTGWSGVDHAALYLGKGWLIDSSSSHDGVSLRWGSQGWYRDHYVWGRDVIS